MVASAHVVAKITGHSLDVRGSDGGRTIVDDLVSGEESQGVLVLDEFVDSSKDVLKVLVVVGDIGGFTVDRVLGSVDVEHKVDASISQGVHTLIVVLGVVNRVNTDGVQAEILELLDVALAPITIGDGVSQVGGTARLVVDTTDIEALVSLEESVALDGDGGNVVTGGQLLGGSQNAGNAQGEGGSNGGALHGGILGTKLSIDK